MPNANFIGLKVFQKDTSMAPMITPANFTNVAVLLKSVRGVPNKAMQITGVGQTDELLGNIVTGKNGALFLHRIFDNANPYSVNVYGIRCIAASGDVVATDTFLSGSTLFMLRSDVPTGAGGSVTLVISAGTTGSVNMTIVYTPPTATPASPWDSTITETYSNLTVDQVYTALNEGLSALSVSKSSLLYVTEYGGILPAISTVTFSAVSNEGSGIVGLAVTSGTVVAGDYIVVAGTSDYNATYEVLTGTTSSKILVLATYVSSQSGTMKPVVDPTAGFKCAGTTNITLSAGYLGDEDPGAWGNGIGYDISVDGNNPTSRVLTVYKLVDGDYQKVGSSISGMSILNQKAKMDAACMYLTMTTPGASAGLIDVTNGIQSLTGGADSGSTVALSDYVGTSDNGHGLFAITSDLRISAIMLAEELASDADLISYGISLDSFITSNCPTAVGLLNLDKTSLTAVKASGISTLLRKRSNLSAFLGYEKIYDADFNIRTIPAVAAHYGAGWIRKMFEKAGLPHIAPGGYDGAFIGSLGITTPSLSEAELYDLVKNVGVNAFQSIPGIGIIARTSRMLSTDNRYYDIHKIRSCNYIADSYKFSLGWIEQEGHTEETRKKLIDNISFFLQDLYNQGMFHKEYGFDKAVLIKCDAGNNSPQDVAQRQLTLDNVVWIVDTIESASINLRSSDRGPLNVSFI